MDKKQSNKWLEARKLRQTRRYKDWRNSYMIANPWCIECLETGHHVPSVEMDHKVPVTEDFSKFWDEDNVQPLCRAHHSHKTARENRGATFKQPEYEEWTQYIGL